LSDQEVASFSLCFLPLSFGTAKVETFFILANFIFFYFSLAFSPVPNSLFSSSLTGCKGTFPFQFSKWFIQKSFSVPVTLCKSAGKN
jgi:hypothetical protein